MRHDDHPSPDETPGHNLTQLQRWEPVAHMDTAERVTRLQMKSALTSAPQSFALLGRDWHLLPGVFAPADFASTRYFADTIPYPVGGSFLDMGCGAGVIAAQAAHTGVFDVWAVDISKHAVANAKLNITSHGLTDTVSVERSDMFDALPSWLRFDTIFWNSNFVELPSSYSYRNDYERAFFDPGYTTHRRYLHGAASHLRDGGRLLLGFSTLGNRPTLEDLAQEAGLRVEELDSSANQEEIDVTYQLLELVVHK